MTFGAKEIFEPMLDDSASIGDRLPTSVAVITSSFSTKESPLLYDYRRSRLLASTTKLGLVVNTIGLYGSSVSTTADEILAAPSKVCV